MLSPLTDHERASLADAAAIDGKLVVYPVHELNRWTIEAGMGVAGNVGMRVQRCPSGLSQSRDDRTLRGVQGTIVALGTDGGSELAVSWDNGEVRRNVKAGKHGNTYELMTT